MKVEQICLENGEKRTGRGRDGKKYGKDWREGNVTKLAK